MMASKPVAAKDGAMKQLEDCCKYYYE